MIFHQQALWLARACVHCNPAHRPLSPVTCHLSPVTCHACREVGPGRNLTEFIRRVPHALTPRYLLALREYFAAMQVFPARLNFAMSGTRP